MVTPPFDPRLNQAAGGPNAASFAQPQPVQPAAPARFALVTVVAMIFSGIALLVGVNALADAIGGGAGVVAGAGFGGQEWPPELEQQVVRLTAELQAVRIPWLTGTLGALRLGLGGYGLWVGYGIYRRRLAAARQMQWLAPAFALIALVGTVAGGVMTLRVTTVMERYAERLAGVPGGGPISGIFSVALILGLATAAIWGVIQLIYWLYVSRYVRRPDVLAYLQ